MPQYDDIIGRGSPTDPLIPEAMVRAVIEELPKSSVMLSRARRVPMTTKTHRQPVLSALPQAYWVGGDTGMKQTTKAEWENVFITAELLAADWSKFVIGVRQDMTFRIFSEGVISDDEGKVILNLMQQDTKVMRVVFRVGFQVANPITRVQPTKADRYPAGVVLTAGSVISS